jgi:hypothetical protein
MDQFDFREHWRIVVETVENDFAPANDDGQQVVEVMCNASGKSSNRFHALGSADSSSSRCGVLPRDSVPAFRPQDFVGAGQIGGAAFHALFQFIVMPEDFVQIASVGDVADMEQHAGFPS